MGRFITIPTAQAEAFAATYLTVVGEQFMSYEVDGKATTHSFRIAPAHETALLAEYPDAVFSDSEVV